MMKEKRCPSCGCRYDGLHCITCGYEPFRESAAQPVHTHARKRNGSRLAGLLAFVVIVAVVICSAVGITAVMKKLDGMWENFPIPTEVNLGEEINGSPDWEADFPTLPDMSRFYGMEIYNENGIIVTVAENQEGASGVALLLKVQNNTDRDVTVTTKYFCANGYMMDECLLYSEPKAGKTVEDSLWISPVDLAAVGIDTISQISFYLEVMDTKTYDIICTSELITLNNDVPAGFVQSVDDSGKEIYNENGIRVIYKGYEKTGDNVYEWVFYIENNTKNKVCVTTNNTKVNGEETYMGLWSYMLPETRMVTSMIVYDLNDLNVSKISDVKTLTFDLYAAEADTWDEIAPVRQIELDVDNP